MNREGRASGTGSTKRVRAKKAKEKMSSTAGAARSRVAKRLRGGGFGEKEPLTNREREILGFFAEGLGTEAIARRLSIARVTVRNHAQRILTKLGVHSRLAAVARAHRDGLIARDPGSSPSERR